MNKFRALCVTTTREAAGILEKVPRAANDVNFRNKGSRLLPRENARVALYVRVSLVRITKFLSLSLSSAPFAVGNVPKTSSSVNQGEAERDLSCRVKHTCYTLKAAEMALIQLARNTISPANHSTHRK